MNLQEKRKKSANIAFALDMLHIVVGILIVIFAVLAFLNPDENRILFPVIFLLAAVLNFANGYDRYRPGKGKKASADRRNDPDGSGSRIVPFMYCQYTYNMVG